MNKSLFRHLCFAAVLITLPGHALPQNAVTSAASTSEVTIQESRTLEIHFRNASLDHILRTLAERTGERIEADGPLPNVTVTFNSTRMPLDGVLDALTRETDTTWRRAEDGRILVKALHPDAAMPKTYGERVSTGALITGVSRAVSPDELAAAVRLVITDKGRVTIDRESGRVDVQDSPEGVRRAKELMRLVAEAHPDQRTTTSHTTKVPPGS